MIVSRLLALLVLAAFALVARAETYELLVVPQFQATEIHRDWQPLVDRIRALSGVSLKLRHVRSIPEFETEFQHGTPDFVFMNPYHAVMARQAQGYVPLVRDGGRLTGVLVVKKDGPVKSLAALSGKELAFPAPNAFGASLYMRALLEEEKGLQITPRYVKTHTNVFRAVLLGEVPAGGAVNNTLAQEAAAIRDRLQVLYETPAVAPHPLAAHPRVPEAVRKAVAEAILKLAAIPDGKALLAACQMADPVAADYNRDYLPLERLNLNRYVVRSD
ncbi:MAG: Phosphate/phosphite/phosphonate transporter substrate-binding protein [Pseudomonadota bacterium]|nr:Phosphate/phosphite/phosphonate transporter substrate-binding protein [Pseudomonadota bacterium]MDQ5881540.1 Phosphate/phosphite/phosphonate transporter substrate-binding protein [Pseudomonadota bacterium]MDQ5905244.1 Phosphate/phosphite/phosphonate transporter substrate-binding protein [Pseudomonadota bacterium]MDQ5916463.1 Phosphate/phosphite/phosphonate transporter substrate-binding protein [Pseudomonadota bacterium]MDQ5959618.1 Phosphate/phosphite/phosphonate transporter substrate-bindin